MALVRPRRTLAEVDCPSVGAVGAVGEPGVAAMVGVLAIVVDGAVVRACTRSRTHTAAAYSGR
ncbi:MAG TPA: hypothetical protein VNN23_09335 [Ornithinibacter sp.]|nr:hypothetical protein [Ornithinibacter sp.]